MSPGDGLLHAVPTSDGTRSAVCGACVRPPRGQWDDSAPDSCPECAQLLLDGAAAARRMPTPDLSSLA